MINLKELSDFVFCKSVFENLGGQIYESECAHLLDR